jgi:hypothetical protein
MTLRSFQIWALLLLIAGPSFAKGPPATTPRARQTASETMDPALARLRYSLGNVAANSRNFRILTGGAFIGAAALFGGALIANERLRTDEPRRLALGVLGVAGAISFIGGVGMSLVPSDFEELPLSFLRSSDFSANRLEMGEALLRGLANRAHATRSIVGGFLVALGAADVIWHLAEGGTPATSFLAYKGALLGSFGLAFLIFKWPAELEYESYVRRETTPPSGQARWDIVPLPEGGLLSFRLPF